MANFCSRERRAWVKAGRNGSACPAGLVRTFALLAKTPLSAHEVDPRRSRSSRQQPKPHRKVRERRASELQQRGPFPPLELESPDNPESVTRILCVGRYTRHASPDALLDWLLMGRLDLFERRRSTCGFRSPGWRAPNRPRRQRRGAVASPSHRSTTTIMNESGFGVGRPVAPGP